MTSVLWFQGGACSGNTMSFINAAEPSVVDLIVDYGLEIVYHPTLSMEIGQTAQDLFWSYARGEKGNAAGKNFLVTDPKLNRPFQFSDPDFTAMFGSPVFRAGFVAPPDDGFFDQSANFAGGIGDDNWIEEWTSFLQDIDIAK